MDISDKLPFPTEDSRTFVPPDIRTGEEGRSSQRNVFGLKFSDPAMGYTKFELDQIRDLQEFWGEDGDPTHGRHNIEETQKLRFLQGSEWDYQKTTDALHEYVAWKQIHGEIKHTPAHAPDRNDPKNFAYWYGVDKCYRPILVVQGERLLRCKQSTHTTVQIAELLVETMNYFISKFTVPGHVEQVTVVMDLKNCDAWESPVEPTMYCAKTLASYFRARLSKVFLLNTPLLFYAIWRMVKYFVPARTVAKINILRSDFMDTLLEHIDAEMIDPALVPQTVDSRDSSKMSRFTSAIESADDENGEESDN